MSSHLIGAVDLLETLKSGKDDDIQVSQVRFGAKPAQELKAVFDWKVKIKNDDGREWEAGTVGKVALTVDVSNRCVNRFDEVNGIDEAGSL